MGERVAAAGHETVQRARLSFQQEQLWLVEQTAQTRGLYNEVCALRLRGPLDVAALERSLSLLVERHAALRTTFPMDGAEPVQLVRRAWPVSLAGGLRDLSALPGADRQSAFLQQAQRLAEAPFDLAEGPLLRCSLFRLDRDDHALLLCVHHIVCDGWSLRLLLRDLQQLYSAIRGGVPAELPPPGASYVDFASWQRAAVDDGDWEEDLRFWRDELAGAATVLELPADHPRPPVKRNRGRREEIPLAAGLSDCLARLTRDAYGSRLAALLTALAALVYRYTGRGDIVLGAGSHGRPSHEFDATVGFFANVVPVRLRPAGSSTLLDLLGAACGAVLDATDHRVVPFEKLVELAQPERDPSYPPLVQVVCTTWDRDHSWMAFQDLDVTLLDVPRERSRFDFMVEHMFSRDGWSLLVEYDSDLFEPKTVRQMMRHYQRVIAAAAAEPATSLAALPMLDQDERARLASHGEVVLDRDGNLLPAGAPGELHRGSSSAGGSRGVPSGRVARRLADGRLEELGLLERRVRLGSVEIQLEQVEAVLREHARVVDAAVVQPRGDGRRLAAYVALDEDCPEAAAEISAFVEARLPRRVAPATVVTLPAIPRGADGAVDAARLPAPRATPGRSEHAAIDQVLAGIWRDLLDAGEVGPQDDFFALGGHSMLATQVVQRIGQMLGVEMSVRSVFENPTLGELAAEVARGRQLGAGAALGRRGPAVRDGPVEAASRPPARAPLSAAQLQIWLNEQLTLGANDDFNSGFAHRIRGPLEAMALRRAVQMAAARHPVLGAGFELGDDLPVQVFAGEPQVEVPTVELGDLEPAERVPAAVRLARQEAGRRFDLERPPLVRALLLRLAPDDHVLMYVMHHLVTDGVSMGVFHRDVAELYAAAAEGRSPALPSPRSHYADYVAWERQWLGSDRAAAARRYWQRGVAGCAELELPTTTGAERATLAVESCRRLIPQAVAGDLAELAASCRATPFMTVSAGLAAVLRDWSGQEDLVIGTLVDNRPLGEFQELMGCFANVVMLRIDCGGNPTFRELVGRVRETVLGAYEHQHLPFTDVLQVARVRRSYARMPLIQTTVQWVEPEQMTLSLRDCRVQPWQVTPNVSRYELTLFVTQEAGALALDLEYATELWDRGTVDRRLSQLATVLETAAAAPSRRLAELVR